VRHLKLILLALLPAALAQAQEPLPLSPRAATSLVDSVAHAYYGALFALYPDQATAKGIAGHDSALARYDPREVRRFIIQTRRAKEKLASFTEDSLSIDTWIDLKALTADMGTQIFLLEELAIWRKNPMLYVDACTNGLYYLALRREAVWNDPDFRSRVRQVPAVLQAGRTNLTEPVSLACQVAASTARGFVPFLEELRQRREAEGVSEDPELDRAARALGGFAAYLDSLAPEAEADFALGYDNFLRLLSLRNLEQESPEEIVAYAEGVLRQSKAHLAELGYAPPPAAVDTAAALRMSPDDVLDLFRRDADSAVAFIRSKDLLTLPEDAPFRVVPTPAFLRVLVPGYAYQPPGPFDATQTGSLYVPVPDSLTTEDKIGYLEAAAAGRLRGVIAHEVFPGHHVHMVSGNRNTSFVRRLQTDTFTLEGWALYCEEMMAEDGYYGPDGLRRVLRGIIFRACRAVVDVRLQTGEFGLDEAVDYMVAQTGLSRSYIESEVRRYAVDPGQPMSYIMGKKAVMEIKERLRQIRGDAFSLKEFHDMVLGCGPVQPYLLRVCIASRAVGRK